MHNRLQFIKDKEKLLLLTTSNINGSNTLFYAQLQQMDGKWNDKWAIMVRKWIKYILISDGKMDNSRAQQYGTCGTNIHLHG